MPGPLVMVGVTLLVACVPRVVNPGEGEVSPPQEEVSDALPPPSLVDPKTSEGQLQLPEFDLWLGFDSIPPIYDPIFTPAGEAPLQDDELIIGFARDGQAKAYPVTVLRFREIVNDELAGLPILVTW